MFAPIGEWNKNDILLNRSRYQRLIRTRAHDERLLKTNRVKNPAYRKSLLFRTATLWNRLDVATRRYKKETEFKAWLKKEYDKKIKALPDIWPILPLPHTNVYVLRFLFAWDGG